MCYTERVTGGPNMDNNMQDWEEEKDLNYDLYYAVFYNEPRDVQYLLKKGANPDYKLPGKDESTKELAIRLKEQEKLCQEIIKMFGI